MKTPFQLIWQRDTLREAVPYCRQDLGTISFPDSYGWDYRDLQERKDLVSTYGAHLRRMSESGGAIERRENPWGWLPNVELSLSDQERLMAALRVLESICTRRITLIETLGQTFSYASIDVSEWLGTVNQWFSAKAVPVELKINADDWLDSVDQWTTNITKEHEECHYDLLGSFSDRRRYSSVEQFLNAIAGYNDRLSTLPGGDSLLDSDIPSDFLKEDEKLRDLGLDSYSIDSLLALAKALFDSERFVSSAKRATSDLSLALGVSASFTLRCVTDLLAARQLLTTAPLDLAHLRSPDFARDGLIHILELGQKECIGLLAERNSLSDHFIVDTQSSAAELIEAASVLDSAPWYGRLGKSYRRAAGVYKSHCHTPATRTRSQKAACPQVCLQTAGQKLRPFPTGLNIKSNSVNTSLA